MKNTVLIVESDSSIRQTHVNALADAGHEVCTVDDGAEALKFIETTNTPHVILSDWAMPQMNGHELCRIIKGRKNLSPTYFILFTSRAHETDSTSAFEAGADDYVIKPAEPREIVARVAAGIRIVELQRELTEAGSRLNDALRLIRRELQVVAEIQRALLPQELPLVQGVQFRAFYRPSSQCGGDYYDVLPLAGNRLGVLMADVSGHGTPAMVAMAMTRLLVHNHAAECETPADFLTRLNRRLFECLPTEQYLTMFYGILDLSTMGFDYASAGHPAPLWWQETEARVVALEKCEGFPLKLIDRNVSFNNCHIDAGRGDRFLLYTDGITDAINPSMQMYGIDRLSACLARRGQLAVGGDLRDLMQDVDAFAENASQMDDITLLEFSIAVAK